MLRSAPPLFRLIAASAILATSSPNGTALAGPKFSGRVLDESQNPIAGAMVSFEHGQPAHRTTVFTDGSGTFRSPELVGSGRYAIRVRRIGWKDLWLKNRAPAPELILTLERETDPSEVAAQLPANHWYALILERIPDSDQREEFKRQCTFCHQQGSLLTRRTRSEAEWQKIVALMGRMGGMISGDLRKNLPRYLSAAYDPKTAVPTLTAQMNSPDFGAPSPAARKAVIDEWELGGRASMQHDLTVHPDGRIYSVDMAQDQLYRLDPSFSDGKRQSWQLPRGDWPLGGAFASADRPRAPTNNSHVGPHSLQISPAGDVWITLALGNQLARFDPANEEWSIIELEDGYYPHTLRFDQRGRIWYTIAASNHVGMFDPKSGENRETRLPTRTWSQAIVVRFLPAILWFGRHFDLRGAAADGEGIRMPIPYGIDVSPEGSVWFSQLNEHRIGRIDPDTFEVEMIETPFPAPRRLRFDRRGRLWIPSFSGSLVSRFDTRTRTFRSWDLPIEPVGSETPYALHVNRRTDEVWICGTNSDSLIRFEPSDERFTVYPMPTRVTYTREIDFDAHGRVWTSNSNAPAWQIEDGTPRVIRLDPQGRRNPPSLHATR